MHTINSVSKFLQTENMNIYSAINFLLVSFLKDYRETRFVIVMDEVTKKVNEMGIDAELWEKYIIRKNKQFDESGSDEVQQSAEEFFRV